MSSSSQLNSSLELANSSLIALSTPVFDTVDFEWNEMHFSAHSNQTQNNDGVIKISGVIGRLFFTIENEQSRNNSLKQILINNRNSDARYKLEKDGTVTYSCNTAANENTTGDNLVKAITLIMLESSMHIKALKADLKSV